jgi:predicted fused transcriptional regulator/phosphomethylpyrimidine kinase
MRGHDPNLGHKKIMMGSKLSKQSVNLIKVCWVLKMYCYDFGGTANVIYDLGSRTEECEIHCFSTATGRATVLVKL